MFSFTFTLVILIWNTSSFPMNSWWCFGGKCWGEDSVFPVKCSRYSIGMFLMFQWNVCDVLLELTFLERVRWLSKIQCVIPLILFSLFRPRFSLCRRKTDGEAEKRRCCDGIFIIFSVTGVGVSGRIQRGFVSLSQLAEWRAHTHTRAARAAGAGSWNVFEMMFTCRGRENLRDSTETRTPQRSEVRGHLLALMWNIQSGYWHTHTY